MPLTVQLQTPECSLLDRRHSFNSPTDQSRQWGEPGNDSLRQFLILAEAGAVFFLAVALQRSSIRNADASPHVYRDAELWRQPLRRVKRKRSRPPGNLHAAWREIWPTDHPPALAACGASGFPVDLFRLRSACLTVLYQMSFRNTYLGITGKTIKNPVPGAGIMDLLRLLQKESPAFLAGLGWAPPSRAWGSVDVQQCRAIRSDIQTVEGMRRLLELSGKPLGGAFCFSCTPAANKPGITVNLFTGSLEYKPHSSHQAVHVGPVNIRGIGPLEHDPSPSRFHIPETPAVKWNGDSTRCVPIISNISFQELK